MSDQDMKIRAFELANDARIKFAGAYALANSAEHLFLRLLNSYQIDTFDKERLVYLLDLMKCVFSDNYELFMQECVRLTTNSDMQGEK